MNNLISAVPHSGCNAPAIFCLHRKILKVLCSFMPKILVIYISICIIEVSQTVEHCKFYCATGCISLFFWACSLCNDELMMSWWASAVQTSDAWSTKLGQSFFFLIFELEKRRPLGIGLYVAQIASNVITPKIQISVKQKIRAWRSSCFF